MPLHVEQLGICSWSLRPDNDHDLVDRVLMTGVRTLQLALNPYIDNDRLPALIQRCQEAGVRIVSGMFAARDEDYSTLERIRETGGIVPDRTWDDNWRALQAIAPLAEHNGIPIVSFHAGFIPEDHDNPAVDKLLDRLGRIAQLFEAHGLRLLFETGQEDAPTLLRFMQRLEAAGIRNAGVNFDPANMILYDKGDPIESLRTLLPWVGQVHIKDAKRTTQPGTWGMETPVGEGEVDWRMFVDVLDAAGFAGGLIIEREAGGERITDAQSAARLIAGLIESR